ncbi:MAG: hypothetical protein JW384_01410 [Nitrosomonadaceae bacterium]|nr:hypothetical protein [Nitrosomonadaceae bacterium]
MGRHKKMEPLVFEEIKDPATDTLLELAERFVLITANQEKRIAALETQVALMRRRVTNHLDITHKKSS